MVIRISLDSNCLNIEHNDPILNKLEKLGDQGKIEFYASGSVWREQTQDKIPSKWRKRYEEKLEKIKFISETAIFEFWFGKKGARFVTEESQKKIDQIMQICFPNKSWNELTINDANDIRMLEAHAHAGLDYFLTKDKHFIRKKPKLETIGIFVQEPDEAFIKKLLS